MKWALYLLVDMSHISGLVAGGAHPSPVPHAHVVTTTTHKSLRGPRSGVILSNDEAIAKKMNSAIFPGLQGGPLMHVVAAKAVCFAEAMRPNSRPMQPASSKMPRRWPQAFRNRASTSSRAAPTTTSMLVDLRPKQAKGKHAEHALDRASITCNKNAIPYDPEKPFVTSGLRLGTPAGTTRGFGPAEFREIGRMIADVVEGLRKNGEAGDGQIEARVKEEAEALCARFPIYPS
jgi:glycine hydroxymethyltransferase